MKKLLALVLVLGLIVAISACNFRTGGRTNPTTTPNTTTASAKTTVQNTSTTTAAGNSSGLVISREQAIDIALQAAGLSREDVYDLEADLDRERGGIYWEVDFETRDYEYSYDIHSETGAITRTERERD